MVNGEYEVAELKSEAFEFIERLDTGVNVDLFSKTILSIVSEQHHRHPAILRVSPAIFLELPPLTTIIQFFTPVTSLKGR